MIFGLWRFLIGKFPVQAGWWCGMATVIWEMWIAMADERVCGRCAALSGNVYRLGQGPQPPLHLFCRCRRVFAYRQEEEIGDGGPVLDPIGGEPGLHPLPVEGNPQRPLPVPVIPWPEGRPPAMPADPWMPVAPIAPEEED